MGHAKGPSNRLAQRAEQHAPIHRTLSLDIDTARKELLNAAQGKSQEAWDYPAAEQAMEAPPYDLTELNSNTKLIEP